MITGQYLPYPNYKESDIEWIGRFPSHWNLTRVKFESYVKARVGWHGLKSDDFTDEGPYLVTGSDFKGPFINWENCYHCDEHRYDQDPYIQLREGDLLITKDGTIGKVALVNNLKGKATLNSGVFVVRPLEENYLTRYYFWLLQSKVFTGFVDHTKTGSTIVHLYQDTFVNFQYPSPALNEQERIANFLDHETAKIDTLIEKQQQLIKLLKEKRQAVISHAVTKGLNPNAPMKDSGVEWLGEVPEHWAIKPLKFACKFQRGHDLPSDKRNEGNIPVVTSAGISATHDTARANAPGLVTGRYGTIGDFTLVEEDYWPLNTTLYSVDLYENKVKFLWYLLQNLKPIFIVNSLKSAVPGVDRNDLHPTPIAMPESKEEQVKIVNYLDQLLDKYRKAEDKAVEQISLLKERRTALISAAVTGKIDVRNWQPENQSAQVETS